MSNINKVRNAFLNGDIRQATNSDIVNITGITPHQQVYQLTTRLVEEGFLSYEKSGREKIFFLKGTQNPVQEKIKTPQEPSQIQILLDVGFEKV